MTPANKSSPGPGNSFPGLFFLAASRPHLLLPAWQAGLTGAAFQAEAAPVNGLDSPGDLAGFIGWSLVLLAVNLVNLLADRKSDFFNAKNQVGLRWVAARTLAGGAATAAALGLTLTAWLAPWLLVPVLLSLVLGVIYSLPPLRLTGRWGWDLAAHLAGYGLLAPWVGANLVAGNPPGSDWSAVPLSGVPGPAAAYLMPLVGMAFLLTALLDIPGDRKAGKVTSLVFLARYFGDLEGWASNPRVRALVIGLVFLAVLLAGWPGLKVWPLVAVPMIIWLGLSYLAQALARRLA